MANTSTAREVGRETPPRVGWAEEAAPCTDTASFCPEVQCEPTLHEKYIIPLVLAGIVKVTGLVLPRSVVDPDEKLHAENSLADMSSTLWEPDHAKVNVSPAFAVKDRSLAEE